MTALETYVLILLIISLSVIGILLIAAVTIGIINSVKKARSSKSRRYRK